jgi:hypothetical protein
MTLSITLSNPSIQSLENSAFLETNNIIQWFDENLLKINTEKTNIINFQISSRTTVDSNISLLINQDIVEPSNSIKFLGIILDNHLNYNTHIEQVIQKISMGIFVLRNLAKISNTEVLLTAYYGLIYPFLSYAVPIWGAESCKTLFLFKI